MSSTVTIQPCKFVNQPKYYASFGYRCYDDYDSIYNNLWEEEDINLPPIEVLKKVYSDRKGNDTLIAMFDFIVENKLGIFVGEDWLEWNQIKKTLT